MKKLVIDFGPPQRSSVHLVGYALLALGMAALVFSAWQYNALIALRMPLEAEQRRLQASDGQETDAGLVAMDPLSKERMEQVAGAKSRLDAPWDALLSGIEGSVNAHVALLGLEPDVAQGAVLVRGEARDMGAALDLVRRVDGLQMLSDAHLEHHEVNVQDPHRPVQFMLAARWLATDATLQGRETGP